MEVGMIKDWPTIENIRALHKYKFLVTFVDKVDFDDAFSFGLDLLKEIFDDVGSVHLGRFAKLGGFGWNATVPITWLVLFKSIEDWRILRKSDLLG